MKIEKFTLEEINLLCIYNECGTATKEGVTLNLMLAEPYIYEPEMLTLVQGVLKKLEAMAESEYGTLSFEELTEM